MTTIGRISAWFLSLLVAVCLFCFLWPLGSISSFFFLFRITMIFAFPVSLLYLPAVIFIRDTKKERFWQLLVSGILIGPISMALWGIILTLRGADPHTLWQGDLGPGLGAGLLFALIIGSLTITFYLVALRLLSSI